MFIFYAGYIKDSAKDSVCNSLWLLYDYGYLWYMAHITIKQSSISCCIINKALVSPPLPSVFNIVSYRDMNKSYERRVNYPSHE